ncbi:MAG: hypothetical protein JXX28_09845 [Deltaproteobacteria bacterium]|nr:hypothetical protein [Deltaproteobacteria bacterium]
MPLAALLLLLACDPTPPCSELEPLQALTVDTGTGHPVFRWEGQADDLTVFVELMEEGVIDTRWDAHCPKALRPCLDAPVSYGHRPPGAAAEDSDDAFQLEPLPLVSGVEYQVEVVRYCVPEVEDAPRFLISTAGFTLP